MSSDGGEQPAPLSLSFDPTDMGVGKVQESGLLYVGRAYAGEEVRWLIERTSDGDGDA